MLGKIILIISSQKESLNNFKKSFNLIIFVNSLSNLSEDIFDIPISVYQVSGEYSMLNLAAQKGVLSLDEAILESIIGFKRAGADIIVSYFSKDIARIL